MDVVALGLAKADAAKKYLARSGSTTGDATFRLVLAGTIDGGVMGNEVPTNTDTTPHITMQSWQSPHGSNPGGFGQAMRLDVMHPSAKNLVVWRMPATNPALPFDATTNPLKDVTWMGAHWWHADDNSQIHAHWSVEVPDSAMALQTRFQIKTADFRNGNPTTLGVDLTNTMVTLSDFTVLSGTAGGRLRLAGVPSASDRAIEWSEGAFGAQRRWDIKANNSNNLVLTRYTTDDPSIFSTQLAFERATGRMVHGSGTFQTARLALIYGVAGDHGFLVQPTASLGAAAGFAAYMFASSDRAFSVRGATADTTDRFLIQGDGRHEWGSGTTTRETYLYRSTTGSVPTLRTDSAFKTGQSVTGSRPSAANVAAGGQWFDTTLNKPIWSNGTAWVDATGAVV